MPLQWRGSGDKHTLIRADQNVFYLSISHCFLLVAFVRVSVNT